MIISSSDSDESELLKSEDIFEMLKYRFAFMFIRESFQRYSADKMCEI